MENHESITEASAPVRTVGCAVYPQGGEAEAERSLDELERLMDTAGAVPVGRLTQMRPTPDRASCLGSGKLKELAELCEAQDARLVVFDCELTPAQLRAIEDAVGEEREVLDRSMLILSVFARHAVTAEGRLQVELAQLHYTAPRLIGRNAALSRLGGGIGTRGPGESKLEIDRRRLKTRIRALEEELEHLASSRETMRAARERSGIVRCAIVGYTNAGKSTLFNRLTDAGILAQDKLFATLDPTTRQYVLPDGTKLLLTDTVGFIRNLPHHLIRAFHSTLEETVLSDVILHVCNASEEDVLAQMEVTESLLEELGASGKPILYVFNQCDRVHDADRLAAMRRAAAQSHSEAVFVSALTGEGMDELLAALGRIVNDGWRTETFRIPYSDGAALHALHENGRDVRLEYGDDCVAATALTDEKLRGRLAAYRVGEEALSDA